MVEKNGDDFEDELSGIIGGDGDKGKKKTEQPAETETAKSGKEKKKPKEEKATKAEQQDRETIAIDGIVLPERMVRSIESIDDEELVELMDSIKLKGLLYPIIVTEESMLVAGLRRYVAFKRLKRKDIPCITAAINPDDVMETSLIENLQRKQITNKQFGEVCYYMLSERKKQYPTQTALAKALSVSSAKITLALQEAGVKTGTSYEKSNMKTARSKKDAKPTKAPAQAQEKFERIGEQHLPKDMAVYVSKKHVEVRARVDLPSKVTARFDVLAVAAKLLKKVNAKDLTKEIALTLEEM